MNPPRVVAIIPARYGSQRLPAKPLADICGKPMVQHVYERSARANLVNAVVVATDDERIMAAVHGFGGRAVMTPASLQTGTDRIAYVARSLPDADIVVNVQGDEPMIEPAMIDQAVEPLIHDHTIEVGTLVRRIDHVADLSNPNLVKVVLDREGNGMYFSRSPIPFGRDMPESVWLNRHHYFKHIGLYVFRREMLVRFSGLSPTPLEQVEKLEQLRILEHGVRIGARKPDTTAFPLTLQRIWRR
jgi:3-deoxy-manno-octulosonate cytidylyltransferase (CMP-KDO synthetase)